MVECFIHDESVRIERTGDKRIGITLQEKEAIEIAYKILLEYQTIDQVMDTIQQEIDDQIENGEEYDN